jgi:oxalate decarboxylase/phosphoglucose isomerase-like protein (cupin superfamily)
MYHREDDQEDFLVLSGECLLLVEEQQRRLQAWDFFHCPPGTDHVLVGAGDGPCVVVAVGSRSGGKVVYPVSELAQEHGAGVAEEADDGATAYAGSAKSVQTPFREGWLPD